MASGRHETIHEGQVPHRVSIKAKERFRRREQARLLGRLLLAEEHEVTRVFKGGDSHQAQQTPERLRQARGLLEAVGGALDDAQDESWEAVGNAWRALKGVEVAPQPTAAPIIRQPRSGSPVAPKVAPGPSPWARQATQTPPTADSPTAKSIWQLEPSDTQVNFRETAELIQTGRGRKSALPFGEKSQHSTPGSAADEAPEPKPGVEAQPPATEERSSEPEDDFSGTIALENRPRENVDPLPFLPTDDNDD